MVRTEVNTENSILLNTLLYLIVPRSRRKLFIRMYVTEQMHKEQRIEIGIDFFGFTVSSPVRF